MDIPKSSPTINRDTDSSLNSTLEPQASINEGIIEGTHNRHAIAVWLAPCLQSVRRVTKQWFVKKIRYKTREIRSFSA